MINKTTETLFGTRITANSYLFNLVWQDFRIGFKHIIQQEAQKWTKIKKN